MSMDTDEFYLSKELAAAKMLVVANKLQATACRCGSNPGQRSYATTQDAHRFQGADGGVHAAGRDECSAVHLSTG